MALTWVVKMVAMMADLMGTMLVALMDATMASAMGYLKAAE